VAFRVAARTKKLRDQTTGTTPPPQNKKISCFCLVRPLFSQILLLDLQPASQRAESGEGNPSEVQFRRNCTSELHFENHGEVQFLENVITFSPPLCLELGAWSYAHMFLPPPLPNRDREQGQGQGQGQGQVHGVMCVQWCV
jgi:hypothetical protein